MGCGFWGRRCEDWSVREQDEGARSGETWGRRGGGGAGEGASCVGLAGEEGDGSQDMAAH